MIARYAAPVFVLAALVRVSDAGAALPEPVQPSSPRSVSADPLSGMLMAFIDEPGNTDDTSGLGGVYPKGLRIGEIVEVADPGGRLLQTARLRPAVDFGRLEQVFVMLRRGPAMELLYSTSEGDELLDASERPAS